ncbi:hypothetical protein L3Q82_020388 [Scortum barcoo]|uniref:Uncharacterized protein n=1 Tax=Scortum barcoo TaxID=214431 RepID=A0ACB8V9D5_9TELE|nr:hypothetical protein L3Q82_020388 [Scortum barcoo]
MNKNMINHWHMVYLWWSAWHFLSLHVAAFNLDTQNVLQKNGDPGSLFGFSIAFHQQLNPAKKNLLLVGAPRSKHQNQVNVTGVVYQCDLTTTSERCQAIEFHNEEFRKTKDINDQWMGVRVTSQGPGKNIMSCAHRYQQWSPSPYFPHLVTGQCYLLRDDLQVGEEERKWRRVVCDYEHLQRRPMNQDYFAYCQQGHGASFAKDNSSLLFGAPGAYQWKGIVRMEPLDHQDSSSEDSRETGDIEQFNSDLIPLQNNSYLGFSIDSGMAVLRKGELTIVSGAPRGGYSGQVAFLKADPVAKRNLSVELVLSGAGLASSFGYDVAVVDLNGDGWEDLAVGAPEFFVKDGLVGGAVYIYINNKGQNWEKTVPIQLLGQKDSMFGHAVENIGDVNQDGYGDIAVGAPYDGSGKVYLYYGSSDGIHKKAAQVLSSGSKKVSLFGYSLSGNLDVDNNQYPDLAVGSLSDSVFVFRAKPVVTVSCSLKVTPNEIDITKQQCDENTCYFAAQACFTYTAHSPSFSPKLMLSYTFEADAGRRGSRFPPRLDVLGSSGGRLELPGQRREICTVKTLRLMHDIEDRLHSMPRLCHCVSVELQSDNKCRSGQHDSRPQSLPATEHCLRVITSAKVTYGSSYKFCSRKTQNNQDVFKSLASEDGVAVITPSEDIALEVTVTNRHGDDAHQSRLIISLPDTLHYSSIVYSTAAETQVSCTANEKGTLIDCELGNPLQRDAEVTFYVILTTSGISLSTKDVNVTLQLKTQGSWERQDLENKEKMSEGIWWTGLWEMGMWLDERTERCAVTGGLYINMFCYSCDAGQVFRPYNQLRRWPKWFLSWSCKYMGRLARPSQVSLGENLKGESAIKSVEEIGTKVQYEFRITNLGRPLKSFTNASLNIYWPKENSVGKWLMYLTQISSKGVQSVPCSPLNEVNPLKHVKGWHDPSRKRREAELEALSTDGFSFLPTRRKYKTLTCSDGLKCVEIRCPLLGLDSTAVMVLHSMLWNTTFTEVFNSFLSCDYSSLNYLDIVVDATLSLTNSPENIGLKPEKPGTKVKSQVFKKEDLVKLTVFLKTETKYFTKVAWWIIFLTVIALLLLLAVLGFLLCKRGCIICLAQNKKASHDDDLKAQLKS